MSVPPAAADVPLRVLIVDDCRDNADALLLLVNQWGFHARSAYNVSAALSLAATFAPEVVVADIAMPGMTGLELAAKLRAVDPVPHSLIAVSGYADDDRREAAGRAGFDFYLVKPPDLDELRGLLEAARRVAGHCRRIENLAERTECLTTQVRGLIDGIRDDLRAVRA